MGSIVSPPLSVDEAMAAYRQVVAEVIEARREAERTNGVLRAALQDDDQAEGELRKARDRLEAAALAVEKAILDEIAGKPPAPPPAPLEPPLDDEWPAEMSWMNWANFA